MRIGELADLVCVNPKATRYYEGVGLLPDPQRAPSGYRDDTNDDGERLRFVNTARRLNLSLSEKAEILGFRERTERPCEYVLGVLDRQVADLDRRMAEMAQLREQLISLKAGADDLPQEEGCSCAVIEHAEIGRRQPAAPATSEGGRRPRLAPPARTSPCRLLDLPADGRCRAGGRKREAAGSMNATSAGAQRRRRALMALLLLAACGGGCGGGGGAKDDPLALAGKPSDACGQAIMDGHNLEAAGKPSPFLPSVQACGSLAAWTAAANAFGIDLKGREPQFVDNACKAASDEVRALKICQEAKAAVADPRRIP